MKKRVLISVSLLLIITQTFANDYESRAKAVRDSIWGWNMTMFNNRTVPTEFANESAIILADYEEINASGKSKLRFLSSLSVNKELYYTSTTRKMVKINDKAALERFSEFSFTESDKKIGYNTVNTMNTYLGARIIKPDGSIKEINVKEAVTVTENKKGTDNYKKLAIPDLQIGDILDYFIQEDYKLDAENVPQSLFVFSGRYPILNYKVHCEINKNLTVEYRSINGAPDFTKTVNEDITYLDAEKENIPKIEILYWTAFYRQLPMIRMNILNNASKVIYKPKSARTKGIYPNLNPDYVMTDYLNLTNDISIYYTVNGSSKTKKHIKNFRTKNPNASNKELADFIYNATKVEWMSYKPIPLLFFHVLNNLLSDNNIQSKIGFITSNTGARPNEIMSMDDLEPIISTVNGQFYTLPTIFSFAGEISTDAENEIAVTQPFKSSMFSTKNMFDFSKSSKEIVPATIAEQNKSKYNSEIGFIDINSQDVTLKLTQEHSGHMKYNGQQRILNFYDADRELRKSLDITTDYISDFGGSAKNKNELNIKLEERRKAQKDSIKSDLEDFHGSKIKEVSNYNILSQGVTNKDSTFKYEAIYTIEGLIKRAGNNIIFSAGKLIGEQLKVDDEDRNRTLDVYMPFARTLEYNILIYIPEGYKIESVDNFKVNIQNEYAAFTSEPVFENNKLIIRVKKSYLKSFIPIAEWNNMLQMLDAANVLFGQSIVLKKV
ncbi:conserved exported hypothetical protein [uncultured Paludibacter sp.]|uniref:DUF3857 domain-containing protein n=1 Tax=uncultured Paludibacter sp. TaxID=497635 RepID=A0A653AC76_9BACT|nr:conserved exported hypothetical protein [uncultured Paludibacter sp.]